MKHMIVCKLQTDTTSCKDNHHCQTTICLGVPCDGYCSTGIVEIEKTYAGADPEIEKGGGYTYKMGIGAARASPVPAVTHSSLAIRRFMSLAVRRSKA